MSERNLIAIGDVALRVEVVCQQWLGHLTVVDLIVRRTGDKQQGAARGAVVFEKVPSVVPYS